MNCRYQNQGEGRRLYNFSTRYYDDPSKYEKGTQDEKYYCEIWIPVKKK